MDQTISFYEELADHYHLIFEDWEMSMERQGAAIAALLSPSDVGPILDCACGIGTQSLALARLGFQIDASDLSPSEVARAEVEAAKRGLHIRFGVDDMRVLTNAPLAHYAAVLCLDNALPHLEDERQVIAALAAMSARLRHGGILILSLRDYDVLMKERPTITPPSFFQRNGRRRLVFQVWEWHDERRYSFLTEHVGDGWVNRHFVGRYRAVAPAEVAAMGRAIGLCDVRILNPAETGYHQPIITGRRS